MSHRKEQKEALRREREERQRAEAEAARRKRLVGYVVAGVLVAALVAVGAVLALGGGDGDGSSASASDFPKGTVPVRDITGLDDAVKASGCELKTLPSEGREHTENPVKYKSNPPTSGPHNPVPAEDGAYLESPSKESLVHSLEHGRIVFQYRPNAPDSVIGGLKALFDEDSFHVILTPNNTNMPYEVAATAWTRLLGCKRMNDRVYDALRAFRDNFRDQAPEQVP